MRVNIDGLDRAAVLAALFNASRQQGMGFLNEAGREPLTLDRAREILVDAGPNARFDYLLGRVMKLSLPVGADEVDCRLYDRDNGPDAGLVVITSLRSTGDINNQIIRYMHEEGTYRAGKALTQSLAKDTEITNEGGIPTMRLGLADVADHFKPSLPKRPSRPDDEELRD